MASCTLVGSRRVRAASSSILAHSNTAQQSPPLLTPAAGPIPDALILLFDALDTKSFGILLPERLEQARILLLPLLPSGVPVNARSPDVKRAGLVEAFRHCDWGNHGYITLHELQAELSALAPDRFQNFSINALTTKVNIKDSGKIDFKEFSCWVADGSDEGAILFESVMGHISFQRYWLSLFGESIRNGASEVGHKIELIAYSVQPPFCPSCGTDDERRQLSEILPGQLILTSWRGAYDCEAVKARGVTHVASIGCEFEGDLPFKNAHDGVSSLCISIDDTEELAEKMQMALDAAIEFLDGAIRDGGCVLVHCAAGISRSTTVVLAYLMSRRGMTLRQAFEHTRASRSVVWPNRGFMRILIKLEERLSGARATMRLSQYELWSNYETHEYEKARTVDRD